MADIYKSVHENQLRNRLHLLHVIDVDSANISKAFAPDIKKAKDSAKEEKIRKVMKEFKEGTLKSSSGELVTDRKQAIAIAISEADNIEKSDDADTDSSEESIEKAQKANIGDIHVWGDRRYRKIANGKWVEVSESHGISKREHEYQSEYAKEMSERPSLHTQKYKDDEKWHKNEASKLSDKEYTDEEVGRGKKELSVDDMEKFLKDKNFFVGGLNDEQIKFYYEQLKNEDNNVQKSVFDEIQENIEKSLNSVSTKVSEELFDEIEKSISHKYFKREGTPGNYKYYYTEEEYKNKYEKTNEENGKVYLMGKTVVDVLGEVEKNGKKYIKVSEPQSGHYSLIPKETYGDRVKELSNKEYQDLINPPLGAYPSND